MSPFLIRLVTLFGILAAAAGVSTAQAQEIDCRFFKVTTENLRVFTEPREDASSVGELGRNDFVCVAGDQQVGDRKWAYIAYRLLGQNQRKTLDGWGSMAALQPATQDEVAAVRNGSAPPPMAEQTMPPARPFNPPPEPGPGGPFAQPPMPVPPAPSGEATASDQEVIRYSEPIASGGYPVQGYSLEQLVKGVPAFPPIEGLPENVWRKSCDNCHQWNRQSLCVQARLYAQDEKMAFRKQHPYGGPEKIAMMKWARGGCQ